VRSTKHRVGNKSRLSLCERCKKRYFRGAKGDNKNPHDAKQRAGNDCRELRSFRQLILILIFFPQTHCLAFTRKWLSWSSETWSWRERRFRNDAVDFRQTQLASLCDARLPLFSFLSSFSWSLTISFQPRKKQKNEKWCVRWQWLRSKTNPLSTCASRFFNREWTRMDANKQKHSRWLASIRGSKWLSIHQKITVVIIGDWVSDAPFRRRWRCWVRWKSWNNRRQLLTAWG